MKLSIPQGTRDFSPEVVRRRQFICSTIQKIFEQYGFQPIETPAMENLSTLMGKYGEEGDRLIFKILNNGIHDPKNTEKSKAAFENILTGKSDARLTERALRYDLTIPFARYVVMHQHEIAFPFRRYQMQPVWRADRPQRGRYREFWQCDADIIGSTSLINEAELISIYQAVFQALGIDGIQVKINNRKLLAGLATCCQAEDRFTDITVAIDKLDKIGWEGVEKELQQRGLQAGQITFIRQYLDLQGAGHEELLDNMQSLLASSELAQKGIEELREVLAIHHLLAEQNDYGNSIVVIDPTLARGLNYYTGFIAEVTTQAVAMGSLGGGGRYDDLTGLFGLKHLSGVGISFGIDRIYDVMEELHLFPEALQSGTRILFVNIEPKAQTVLLRYVMMLRKAGIAAEYYADGGKFDKQMKYADKRHIPYVGIVGERELQEGSIQLKNMESGMQEKISPDMLLEKMK